MKLFRSALRPALEEASDGQANAETEHVFYARLANLEQLQHAASMEGHEQWEIFLPKLATTAAEGRMRVRKTVAAPFTEGTEAQYVFTTKTKMGANGAHRTEVSVLTTVDHFEQFKQLAPGGLVKHRYNFPIEGTDRKWEVDMFLDPKNPPSYQPWCKIDLEVQDLSAPIPELPLEVVEIIGPAHTLTPERQQFVQSLYRDYFITPNQRIER